MIELIIKVILFVKQLAYYILLLSQGTGKLIFFGLSYTFEISGHILKSLRTLTIIMLEDFHVFFDDIASRVKFVISGLLMMFEVIINSLLFIAESVRTMISLLTTSISNVWNEIGKLFMNIGLIFIKLKHVLVLFGSGVWFTIESIPLVIMYIISLPIILVSALAQDVFQLIKTGLVNVSEALNTVVDFIFDMPLEALAGLLAAGCILYVLVKFHIILYQIIKRTVISLTRSFIANFYQILLQCKRLLKVRPRRTTPEEKHETNDCLPSENVCVICQEREKCVLILPCKHLCLCDECSGTLRNYNRRCPVCRSYAQRTMKIYI